MQWSLFFFYIFALSFAGMSLALRVPIWVDLPSFLFLSLGSDFPFHSIWTLQNFFFFLQCSSFLVRSSQPSTFTNPSKMALEHSLFTVVLLNVWSPALDTQGCVTFGLMPTCSCPAYRNCVAPKLCPNNSWEPNCSSRTWNLLGWSLQDFQAIHLCSQMTTLHNVPSGLSVLFVFMHVYTMIKSNKIFLATWISNQSSIISSDYHWNGRFINHKITPARHHAKH
jgi:hypothetical protein